MFWKAIPVRSVVVFSLAFAGVAGLDRASGETAPQVERPRSLPPGVSVEQSAEIPAASRDAIGAKLGGKIEKLSNSTIRVHGKPIRVNVIVAADDSSADALWAALNRIKKPPYLHREGRRIVEFVLPQPDDALARKTAWELGLEPKPKAVRYRVTAELATIDKSDDMAANPLFQACLAQNQRNTAENLAKIADLAGKFAFGRSLTMRNPATGGESTAKFDPAPVSNRVTGSKIVHEFAEVPKRLGIPSVQTTIETTVAEPSPSNPPRNREPDASLTAATPRWPVADPKIRELAAKITAGRTDADSKVEAILAWLTPGKNVRYEGQTGSRWGTLKALDQKFGHCWDFSDLFVTLARASGVPARQVAGWLYGSSGHVWAEWFDPKRGWLPVDPTGGGILPCGIYHIPYFSSDDGEMPIVYLAMPKIEIVETR